MNAEFLVADLSNSRTKLAPANAKQLGERILFDSPTLTPELLTEATNQWAKDLPVVVASVVPEKTKAFHQAFPNRVLEITCALDLGVGIDFPDPSTIGPDRLANAAAAASLYPEEPAIIVDFGTAVTFDVISKNHYIGGVIAPGLDALTGYLHGKTALLPEIELSEPASPIGKSTKEAMLAGAVIGYRGLVKEILSEVEAKIEDGTPQVIATGGYADLIATGVNRIQQVDPMLTLKGIQAIALRNLPQKQD